MKFKSKSKESNSKSKSNKSKSKSNVNLNLNLIPKSAWLQSCNEKRRQFILFSSVFSKEQKGAPGCYFQCMKAHWRVSVFCGEHRVCQVLCSYAWQPLAPVLSLQTRIIPLMLGFSWPFWDLYKQFIQIILKLMGAFSAQWDMKEAKWRNLTGQKIQLYINSSLALEVTIWISLEQEVKASLSETITFVKSASQAASGFSCSFPPVLATICSAKNQKKTPAENK